MYVNDASALKRRSCRLSAERYFDLLHTFSRTLLEMRCERIEYITVVSQSDLILQDWKMTDEVYNQYRPGGSIFRLLSWHRGSRRFIVAVLAIIGASRLFIW